MSDYNPYEQPEAELHSVDLTELDIHEGARRPAGHGMQWVGDGWAIFSRQWGVWSGAAFLSLLVSSAAGLVPFIGFIFQMLISPVLTAGLLYMASRADKGEVISVGDLFQGFQDGPGRLMLFGLVFTLMVVVVLVLTGLAAIPLLGPDLNTLMQAAEGGTPPAPSQDMVLKLLLVGAIYLLLLIPVMAAYWFALPLVYFGRVGILSALAHSVVVCLKNFIPLFVYGVMLTFLFIGMMLAVGVASGVLTVVSQGVGIAVAVIFGLIMMFAMVAVMMASWYASFRDIFITPE